MAFENPSRVPAPAQPMRSGQSLHDAASNRFPVFVRLRVAPAGHGGGNPRVPLRWLIADLVQGGFGTSIEANEQMIAARFPSMHTALLASRRMQWAARGYAEGLGQAECSLSILVLDPADLQASSQPLTPSQLLEQVDPRQIWVSSRVASVLDVAPGFQLGRAPSSAFRELQWHTPALDGSRTADESSLSRLLSSAGKQFQAVSAVSRSGLPVAEEGAIRSVRRSAWPFVGGGMAVVAAAVLGIALWLHGKASSTTGTAPDTTQTTTGQTTSGQTNTGSGRTDSVSGPRVVGKPNGVDSDKTKGNLVTGCSLSGSQIGGKLQTAEKDLDRGSYDKAIPQFNAVLACEPANAQAADGLKQARQMQRAVEGK